NNGEQTVITVPFYNAENGSLLIRKIDSVTHAPLAGVEFLVTDSQGTFVGDSNGQYVTNAGGIIHIEGITPGTTLVIRETRTIPGYVLDDTAQTITVKASKVNTVEFRNQPEPTIIIYKQDARTGRPLSGVSFSVKTSRGTAVGDGIFVTDEDGKIVLTGLNPGAYIVTETATLPGYVLDRTPYTVVVGAAEIRTLTVGNQPRARLLVQKFDRVTGRTLAGTEFRIEPVSAELLTDNEGLTSATNLYRTDENGQILLENLLPGAYLIKEVHPPEGYALDEEAQTVTLRPGVLGQAWFYDSPLASLTILKRDAISLQPLANAAFTVRTADGTLVGDNNGVYVTGEDGMATVTGLQPNETLVVTEDSAPAGYVKDGGSRTIRVRSGTVNSLIFNDNPTTTLLIHKYASGTDRAPLAGVEFKVVNSRGEVVGMNNGIYYTDSQGDIMITGLEPGVTINVRETKTIEGFVLDGTPQEILIQAGDKQELTFWNQRKGSLILRKVDSETGSPIPGAEFNITFADGRPVDVEHSGTASNSSLLGGILAQFGLGTSSSNGRYVTDARGEIVIPGVVGTIVATEVRAPEGYAIDPANRSQTVEVRPEDAQTLTFGNPRLQTLTVTKYQAGTTTPVSGAAFLVTDGYGAGLGPSRGEYVTDRNGQFVITDLEPGTNVTVRETAAPEEYALDGTP
ncbi:MAG: hypothetical protein J6X53_08160, partial [Abditibacteriota bacterium]|nr:hypothetical protein [Abditibacteriota bacterium]